MLKLIIAFLTVASATNSCSDDFFTKDIEFGVRSGTDTTEGGGESSGEDQDSDGLSDSVEADFSLDETNSDSDRDGFADGLEFVVNSADPLNSSQGISAVSDRSRVLGANETAFTGADTDQDGLSDIFESNNQLDPQDPDSDDDGYSDGLELVGLSDPFDSDSIPTRTSAPNSDDPDTTVQITDLDGDGLSLAVETTFGTQDSDPDSDNDGFGDGIELATGSDPNLSDVIPDFNVPSP